MTDQRVFEHVSEITSKYTKVRTIGKGSFGKAILVKNKNDSKLYVMKQINVQKMEKEALQSALNEVNVLQLLKHENIIGYHESFMSKEGDLCIIMDYADGGDIGQKIHEANGKFFPEEQILEWFIQIALAVKHIHDRNILHRDLKTQNIFLTKDNVIKLGDFGISKILDSKTEMAKTIIGTPYYLAPELCENKPYNSKSDIWALGCVLYEITCLKHAFEAQNIGSLIMKILKGDYPPIPDHYSENLRELISSMLQRDPYVRPSIEEILSLPFIQKRNAKVIFEKNKRRILEIKERRERLEWNQIKQLEIQKIQEELHPSRRISVDTMSKIQIERELNMRRSVEIRRRQMRREQYLAKLRNSPRRRSIIVEESESNQKQEQKREVAAPPEIKEPTNVEQKKIDLKMNEKQMDTKNNEPQKDVKKSFDPSVLLQSAEKPQKKFLRKNAGRWGNILKKREKQVKVEKVDLRPQTDEPKPPQKNFLRRNAGRKACDANANPQSGEKKPKVKRERFSLSKVNKEFLKNAKQEDEVKIPPVSKDDTELPPKPHKYLKRRERRNTAIDNKEQLEKKKKIAEEKRKMREKFLEEVRRRKREEIASKQVSELEIQIFSPKRKLPRSPPGTPYSRNVQTAVQSTEQTTEKKESLEQKAPNDKTKEEPKIEISKKESEKEVKGENRIPQSSNDSKAKLKPKKQNEDFFPVVEILEPSTKNDPQNHVGTDSDSDFCAREELRRARAELKAKDELAKKEAKLKEEKEMKELKKEVEKEQIPPPIPTISVDLTQFSSKNDNFKKEQPCKVLSIVQDLPAEKEEKVVPKDVPPVEEKEIPKNESVSLQLPLPTVENQELFATESHEDLGIRIEKLRHECEKIFGEELLLKLYKFIREREGEDKSTTLQSLSQMIGTDKEYLIQHLTKIQTLIMCEDIYYG